MIEEGLAALVVTYHRPEPLARVLKGLLSQTVAPAKILVFDNGQDDRTWQLVRDFSDPRLEYFRAEGNLGPAGALRRGFLRLKTEGFQYFYWTNDDVTDIDENLLRRRLEALRERGQDGVVGVARRGAWWNWRLGKVVELPNSSLRGLVAVDILSVETLFARQAIDEAYLPPEELFFGYEEVAYCLKLRSQGYSLLLDGDELLRQRRMAMGSGAGERRRKPRTAILWRYYYRDRNYVYLMRKVFRRSDLVALEIGRILARVAYAPRYGIPYAVHSARYRLSGILDGLRGRMGIRFMPEEPGGNYPVWYPSQQPSAGPHRRG